MKRVSIPANRHAALLLRRLRRAALSSAVALSATAYLVMSVGHNLSNPQEAGAQTTSTLYWLTTVEGDGFYNFDFKSYNDSSNNVDWPIRFLFRHNAEIDKVKNAIDGCGEDPNISPQTCNNGGTEHHLFNDNGYGLWDDDGGKKQANSCSSGAQHIRVYANPDGIWPNDRNYNSQWLYYVFGSVHKDFEGGSGGSCTTFYSAEGEEGWWVQRMLDALPSWDQQSNSYFWYNADSGHWDLYDGNWHWTQSNGYASYVWVD